MQNLVMHLIFAKSLILHVSLGYECTSEQVYIKKVLCQPFKRKPHKMVKYTQTIRRLLRLTILWGWRLYG